MADKIGHQ